MRFLSGHGTNNRMVKHNLPAFTDLSQLQGWIGNKTSTAKTEFSCLQWITYLVIARKFLNSKNSCL